MQQRHQCWITKFNSALDETNTGGLQNNNLSRSPASPSLQYIFPRLHSISEAPYCTPFFFFLLTRPILTSWGQTYKNIFPNAFRQYTVYHTLKLETVSVSTFRLLEHHVQDLLNKIKSVDGLYSEYWCVEWCRVRWDITLEQENHWCAAKQELCATP